MHYILLRKLSGVLSTILVCSCSNNLYFGTSTSVGLSVEGTSKIPTEVSFAHSRKEVAIVPNDANGNAHSVFGSLDSEWTWQNGFIVEQIFATGKAADIASTYPMVQVTKDLGDSNTSEQPLVFSTGTKLGLGLNFGETLETPGSLIVGYRRHERTLMPNVQGKKEIDPVFADISIVGDSDQGIEGESAPRLSGVRVVQRFATGVAALNAAGTPEVRRALNHAVYRDPVLAELNSATHRFEKEAALRSKFLGLGESEKINYVKKLNDVFARNDDDELNKDTLQRQIGTLSEEQLKVAMKLLADY